MLEHCEMRLKRARRAYVGSVNTVVVRCSLQRFSLVEDILSISVFF